MKTERRGEVRADGNSGIWHHWMPSADYLARKHPFVAVNTVLFIGLG